MMNINPLFKSKWRFKHWVRKGEKNIFYMSLIWAVKLFRLKKINIKSPTMMSGPIGITKDRHSTFLSGFTTPWCYFIISSSSSPQLSSTTTSDNTSGSCLEKKIICKKTKLIMFASLPPRQQRCFCLSLANISSTKTMAIMHCSLNYHLLLCHLSLFHFLNCIFSSSTKISTAQERETKEWKRISLPIFHHRINWFSD